MPGGPRLVGGSASYFSVTQRSRIQGAEISMPVRLRLSPGRVEVYSLVRCAGKTGRQVRMIPRASGDAPWRSRLGVIGPHRGP